MDCQQCLDGLGGYLDGELAALMRAELDFHLRQCRSCRHLFVSCQQTIQVYRQQPAPELPAGVHRKMMQRLQQHRPPLAQGENLSR